MEVAGIFIIILLTNTENIQLAYIGLGFWALSNILFAIYYCACVSTNANQVLGKMNSKSKCIYYSTLILSFLFTLRTYRALYSGLFKSVASYLIQPI